MHRRCSGLLLRKKPTRDTSTEMLRFTRNTNKLTLSQRLFYEENGYLIFPQLVPKEILDKCSQRFDDIVANKVPRGSIIVMRDVKDRKSVNKLQDINHDEVFREYIEHKSILDVVEAFTGSNIMAMHSMLIAKPPDIGFGSSKHPPHQDLYYFPFRPADVIVAAWTAIETCTRENGCLFVSPGTHALGHLYKHDYPPGSEPGSVNKFYHGILDLPKSVNWKYLEMQPRDTVFFHPLLIHGSGINKSQSSRRSISCHYAAAECQYIDVSKSIQNRIEDEVMEHVRKRFPGLEINYQDVWRHKSTLVHGIRSSL
ncbi:PREDICTED: phytanoyl-CoA dioxygenase, peroxisomal-like isoform X1 [Eufriesea mexicana]|uniref:phytanoyl-CoA dioxygenase, peroxisomal-like isoform X1 n=1 Tax=Eufriesea mexicana TaxID=516756 RepID=UPI00083C096A|nr:PREDICTED: phytanoyl-CoA dioxygenase, peroxisomal-like isoform X1 [Eufriesea mexicana]XP_017766204.1 PREDICTED: phytanoyl-CoA dioxygenase, peroxisomal-like isoform X1 [Eufriesea mexicana]